MGLPTTSSGGFLTEQEEEEGEWDSLQLLDVAFLLASGGRADSLTPQCATDGWGSVAASWISRGPAPGHGQGKFLSTKNLTFKYKTFNSTFLVFVERFTMIFVK